MEISYPANTRLLKVPQKIEFTVFLIREELKNRKLTNDLGKVGFDTAICISDFSSLIFASIGFKDKSDSFYEWYTGQLDTFCEDIDLLDGTALSEEAFNFYIHLRVEKRIIDDKP